MDNVLSKEDIENSVEVQWRKLQIKTLLIIWLIIACAYLFIAFISLLFDSKNIGLSFGSWLIAIVICGLPFGGVSIYNLFKLRYVIKNHTKFTIHEVCLDNFSNSYIYRGAVYYTVKVIEDGRTIKVDTNPYFSNDLTGKFKPENYNGKKVYGLYDKTADKFYIIRTAN